jgi:hypothetical protein
LNEYRPPPKPQDARPDRIELFAFYFLGVNPDGEYRFANAHHVARYYRVSSDAVLRWLGELDIEPRDILRQQFDLAGAQLELQLELPNLDPAGVRQRVKAILEELDGSEGGRRFWEDS